MRRADRLFRIVEFLKARRQAVRAKDLAEELEVSMRTIYRDIDDLCMSGAPIIGEAGVGYVLDRDYLVRPLAFDMTELEALSLGAQMVKSWPDKDLSKAAQSAIDKITATLPDRLYCQFQDEFMLAFPSKSSSSIGFDFGPIRKSIRRRNKISFSYAKENEQASSRIVRPLALAHFAPVWLLLGWCEAREDFRNFRLDRMVGVEMLQEHFTHEKGKRLADYKKMINQQ